MARLRAIQDSKVVSQVKARGVTTNTSVRTGFGRFSKLVGNLASASSLLLRSGVVLPRAVVGEQRLLRRALILGNVLKVDPDAVPDRTRARACRRRERLRASSFLGRLRILLAPLSSAAIASSLVLVRAISISGIVDSRRPVPFFAPLRRLLGRAELVGEVEQRVEAARGVVHALPRIADARRTAAGTVATVNASGRQSATSSQQQRRRHPGVGRGPHRVGRRHRAVLGVLVEVDEHALAFLLPPSAVARSGARRSTSRATAWAASRTNLNGQRRSMRA